MAVPVILSFLVKMAARLGNTTKAKDLALKKYGKEALKNITKSKPVKHKTELQRVKEQIARDLKKPKTKKPTGKPTGYTIRNFRGKPEPTYGKPKLVRGSARWIAEQKKKLKKP